MDSIIDHLYRTGFRTVRPGGRVDLLHDALIDGIRGAVVVDASPIAAWVHARDREFGPDEFGPQRAPFPVMWVEAPVPNGMRVGSLVSAVDEFVCITTFAVGSHGPASMAVAQAAPSLLMEVAEDGRPTRIAQGRGEPAMFDDDDSFLMYALYARAAIGFMNCKNVRIDEVPRVERTGRKGERDKRLKLPTVHRIYVPGLSGSTITEGIAKRGVPVSPHMVRGHFKTFTDEKPLLGQHTGTYWWGHHVRGGEHADPAQYVVRPPRDRVS